MAKGRNLFICLLLVFNTWSSGSSAIGIAATSPGLSEGEGRIIAPKAIHPDTACIAATYLSQLWVRELTDHNDGPQVEMYLRGVGLPKGYAWCAAFVKWCLSQCGVDTRQITAWAATTYNAKNPIWAQGHFTPSPSERGQGVRTPQHGDVLQLWDYRHGYVAHTGFIHQHITGDIYETVEGNVNLGGPGAWDGVYRLKRSIKSIYTVSRWI